MQTQSSFYPKERTKKFNPLKGNIMDVDENYSLLPSIFQNNVENSQLQIDLRVIVNNGKSFRSKFFKNHQIKTVQTFYFLIKIQKTPLWPVSAQVG